MLQFVKTIASSNRWWVISIPVFLISFWFSGCVTTSPVQRIENTKSLNAYTCEDLIFWVKTEEVDTLVKVFGIQNLHGKAQDTMMVNRLVQQDVGFDCPVDTLQERKVVARDTKKLYDLNQNWLNTRGTMKSCSFVVQNCINVQGETVAIRILPESTCKLTIANQQRAAETFLSYKYEPANYSNYCLECGKITLEMEFNISQN